MQERSPNCPSLVSKWSFQYWGWFIASWFVGHTIVKAKKIADYCQGCALLSNTDSKIPFLKIILTEITEHREVEFTLK